MLSPARKRTCSLRSQLRPRPSYNPQTEYPLDWRNAPTDTMRITQNVNSFDPASRVWPNSLLCNADEELTSQMVHNVRHFAVAAWLPNMTRWSLSEIESGGRETEHICDRACWQWTEAAACHRASPYISGKQSRLHDHRGGRGFFRSVHWRILVGWRLDIVSVSGEREP